MLTVIVPIGRRTYLPPPHDDVPIWLKNVQNRPIMAWAIDHIERLNDPKQYLVVTEKEIVDQHQPARILQLYTDADVSTVSLLGETQGMPCSILMAIDTIDLGAPVLVTSLDQSIDTDLQRHLDYFESLDADAGCIGFQSVYPKWSYARIGQAGDVEEIREKTPISTNALTTSYWFRTGQIMRDAIMGSILRGERKNGVFYLAPCLNEIILQNRTVAYSKLDEDAYFNFYDQIQLAEFSNSVRIDQSHKRDQLALTRRYVDAFNARDIDALEAMFAPDMTLTDPSTPTINGRDTILKFLRELFGSFTKIDFVPQRITHVGDSRTLIEFELTLDGQILTGVDIITFRDGLLSDLTAYLHQKHGTTR